jgi:hypothetical protein
MIPEERFSSATFRGQLYNPWSRRKDISVHWGPVAIQDTSQGLGARLWQIRVLDGLNMALSAPGVAESVWYTHTQPISEISLAFDQNARPVVAFVDEVGGAYLRWFDPVPNAIVNTNISSYARSPRVTLDDNRPLNLTNSDVILGYVRGGIVRYRRQRDRFMDEYTPRIGVGGATVSAGSLLHISMNSNQRLEFIVDGGGGVEDWTLPMIIEDICERANLPPERLGLSLMDWQRIVRGFTIGNAYAASGSLQSLSSVFFFDPQSANGRVHFVQRGADAKATIYEDDMIDNGEPIEEGSTRRGDPIGVPRVLHLNYYDVAGGLNTDKQRSERPEGTRADGEQSLQTPVVLSADEAATVVARTHGLMVEQQKGELNFSLPDNWLRLTESDPVFVQTGTKMVRAIITKVETDDGEQRYTAIRDRQSLYTTQVQGIPAAPVTRPPSSVAGPTVIEFLDIPILRDTHDQLGFYLAVSGVMPAWPGAYVELSLDGGQNYIDGQTTQTGSVIGELVTPLGDHPHEFPDTVNRCEIQIKTPNELLTSTNLAGMLNRRNRAIIGDEIVNFADVDEVTPGVWDVGHWLRGRLGTDAVAHSIGERFVLLDTAMFIPAELAWLGRDLTFRAATLGRPIDEATITTVTFTGASQTERRPAYLSARRDGADAVISWQGVGRLGAGANVAMGAYFQGYRVTLTDGITTQTHDTTANALTTSLSAFVGPVTIRVQQRNQITGLGPHIEVTI